MIVAVPTEVYPGETRVSLIPAGAQALVKAGFTVAVQAGAGRAALHPDSEYEAAGARIEADRKKLLSEAEAVLLVRGPGDYPEFPADFLSDMRDDAVVVAFLDPLGQPAVMRELGERGMTLLSMELMPRITRAQSMDALSSMASIAGYKAVLMAADRAPTMFPMMMTAAGTLKPTKVFVLGAGVAGLQAIATAKRLGAVVEGYDIRTEVKDQVQSLGGKFVELKVDVAAAEGAGGYAAQQSPEFIARQQELLGQHLQGVDVIITTAAVPGRKAPTLIPAWMIDALHPGTILIDLAAERGGNCELTQPGETVDHNGVMIVGPMNVPAQVPNHASQMYSKNMQTFLLHLAKDGALDIDPEDEITAGTLVARAGKITHARVAELAEG